MSGKLNCRSGDLAFIVSADSEVGRRSIGKIVRVLELARPGRHRGGVFINVMPTSWFIEFSSPSPVPLGCGGSMLAKVGVTSDKNLRPIRDQPGNDQTLEWAGLPKYHEDHPASLTAVRESLEDLA